MFFLDSLFFDFKLFAISNKLLFMNSCSAQCLRFNHTAYSLQDTAYHILLIAYGLRLYRLPLSAYRLFHLHEFSIHDIVHGLFPLAYTQEIEEEPEDGEGGYHICQRQQLFNESDQRGVFSFLLTEHFITYR